MSDPNQAVPQPAATSMPIPPAPAPIPTVAPAQSTFEHFISACHHGAALIYHDMVAVETKLATWRSDNPQVAAIFDQGIQYVADILTAHGIPVLQGELVAKTIAAALRQMAAGDASIQSGDAATVVTPAS